MQRLKAVTQALSHDPGHSPRIEPDPLRNNFNHPLNSVSHSPTQIQRIQSRNNTPESASCTREPDRRLIDIHTSFSVQLIQLIQVSAPFEWETAIRLATGTMWRGLKGGHSNAENSITVRTIKYRPIIKPTLLPITSVKAVGIISNVIRSA